VFTCVGLQVTPYDPPYRHSVGGVPLTAIHYLYLFTKIAAKISNVRTSFLLEAFADRQLSSVILIVFRAKLQLPARNRVHVIGKTSLRFGSCLGFSVLHCLFSK